MKFCAEGVGMVRGRPLTHITSPSAAVGVKTLDARRDAELLRRRLLEDAWRLVDITLSSVDVTCSALVASRDSLPVGFAARGHKCLTLAESYRATGCIVGTHTPCCMGINNVAAARTSCK